MKNDNRHLLREKIETTFGKKIFSFKECIELHNDILKRKGLFVGIHTLRRFFGLVKSNHTPSFTTLNILAVYCGYSSIHELHASVSYVPEQPNASASLLSYLITLFKDTVVQSQSESTFANIVRHTIYFLEQEPQLIEPFQREIARTKNGQEFYFERFINIDKLHGYYGDGLRHYLAEKTSTEAQIFGNASLALRYWLTANDELFNQYANKVVCCAIDESIHPFVCGRYFGTKVLLASAKQMPLSSILKETKEFYDHHKKTKEERQRFPGFETTITLILILAEEWEEALFYANRGLAKQRQQASAANQIRHSLLLYKALALAHTNKPTEAALLYDRIDPLEFYFLSKKLLSILHTKLGVLLKKIKPDELQLDHLISQTGFVRMRDNKNSGEVKMSGMNKNEQRKSAISL